MSKPEEKLIAMKFTSDEIHELNSLLANGVCEYDDPSNEVAKTAYDKISRAASRAIRNLREPS